jgi:hypothetical protein
MTQIYAAAMTASLFLAAPAYAELTQKDVDYCAVMESGGHSLMEARQRGVTQIQMLNLTNGDDHTSKALREMVGMVFKEPRMFTDQGIARSIADFSERVATICLDARSEAQ